VSEPKFIPEQIAREIESFVECEFADAARYDNREVLDESGVYRVRRLVAAAFAAGFDAGERSEQIRYEGVMRREREREATS
jgi:hypothetical protein